MAIPTRRRRPFRSLADYLARSGESQAALAARLGVSQTQISYFARGVRCPRPAMALKIARTLRIPLDSFTRAKIEYDEAAAS